MGQSEKKALKSGIWYTISNFIVKGIGFLTAPVFNRIMAIPEKGEWDNFSTWAGVLVIITSLNLEASLIRAKFDYKDKLDEYIVSIMYLSTFSTILWFIIYIIFKQQFVNLLSMDSVYINIIFVYLLFSPIIQIFQTVERIQFKYKWTVFISMALAISTSLLSLGLVLWMKNKTDGRVYGFVVPVLIIGLTVYIYFLKKGYSVNVSNWKYALGISLPFIPHLLSMFVLSSVDRIMIKKMCGANEIALYSTAGTVGSIISILITSVNGAYSPWLGEKLNKKDYGIIKKISIPYVLVFAYMTCCISLATPELLYIIGGDKYMAAKHVMLPIIGGCFFQFVYCMYVNVEQYEKKTKGMAVASIICAIINFVLNYIYIPKYGYTAAAYTTLVSYFILLVLHMILVHSIKMSHVYSNFWIMLFSIIIIMIILLSGLLIDMILVRWAILLISCLIGIIVVWKNWSKIKKIFAKNK